MKATAVYADGHIVALDLEDESKLIGKILRIAHERGTRAVDVKIDWPKVVIHETIAVRKHSFDGDRGICGDCGKRGSFDGDTSSHNGATFNGAISFYSCGCENHWSETESAS